MVGRRSVDRVKVFIFLHDIRIYEDVYMGKRGLYVRVDEGLLSEFTRRARALGLTRSEAVRKAMEDFITSASNESMTSKMRGFIKSKLSLRELEEAYTVFKT